MQSAVEVYFHPIEVDDRLGNLDLDVDTLWRSLQFGQAYAADCTRHDPPSGKGIIAWDKVNRMLRDLLVPSGWSIENHMNYAMTVHPNGKWAVIVATGDEQTGLPTGAPQTRSSKGPATQRAISRNINQLSFAQLDPTWSVRPARLTWILLYRFDAEDYSIYGELSLPVSMTSDGHVNRWQTRIMLSDPKGDSMVTPVTPQFEGGDDIDVPVELKA